MNRKPNSAPRFAVDRADMLSRLPGVKLPASSKHFARGKPKLYVVDQAQAAALALESTFPTPWGTRKAR